MPDYIFLLESRLMPDQLQVLNFLQEVAQEEQLNLYLAGGAVRDLLLGSTIRDLDFVLEGNPVRIVRRFEDPAPRTVEVDEKLRRAEVVLRNGVRLSLEMARSETYDEPGRPPQIRQAAILDDLRRRDFTINAMGISLNPGSRGLMLDPTNGLADIESRELRTLHNYSFLHDSSRLLRLVRFSARLGYQVEERTAEQYESALERQYLRHLTTAQLKKELEQITREPNAVAVLKALQSKNLLEVFHPALQRRGPDYEKLAKYQKGCRQAEEHGYRVDAHPGGLYYLLRRLSSSDAKRLLKHVGMEAIAVRQWEKWLKEVKKVVADLGRARKAKPVQVYRMLEPVPVDMLVFALTEYRAKKPVHTKISNYLYKYRPYRARLPAQELEALGVPRGRQFDEVLEKYFEAQLGGKIRKGTDVAKFLRKLAGLPEPKPEPPPEPPSKKAEKAVTKKATRRALVRKALLKTVARRKGGGKTPTESHQGRAKAAPGKVARKASGKAVRSRPKKKSGIVTRKQKTRKVKRTKRRR